MTQDTQSKPLLAGIRFQPREPIDAILTQITTHYRCDRISGYVQKRHKDRDCGTLVYVRNLRSGEEMSITKNRGAMAKGCKLDGDALSSLSEQLAQDIEAGSDLLIVARFGRSEAEGRGLRDVISRAMELEIPVLVGVRGEYADAWAEFHGGIADTLPLDENAILTWVKNHRTAVTENA
ncbi:DUF2478 domain-containing protein [Thalassospira lucentensis]|uniref:DUF2478 domain-containing protein n=1 Tax=Thalassospira lucentensis TaxID=168935 RepID=UPI0003B59FED|nr:DUF2478 domain-containing protein [Thalassospira lucentensis]RCK30467.1 molybdenum ABC transporter ATP-binding protein [Thalassospira lucentensis MCCC 1A00383 = DSM 14000]